MEHQAAHTELESTEMPVAAEVEEARNRTRIRKFPKLFWAGSIIFAMNVAVGVGVAFSPNLAVNMYGEEGHTAFAVSRPSPFTEVVSTAPVRIRPAAKVQPVLVEQQAAVSQEDTQPGTINLPRTSESATASIRPAAFRSVQELQIPRVTAVYNDIAPRRASESMVKAVLTN